MTLDQFRPKARVMLGAIVGGHAGLAVGLLSGLNGSNWLFAVAGVGIVLGAFWTWRAWTHREQTEEP